MPHANIQVLPHNSERLAARTSLQSIFFRNCTAAHMRESPQAKCARAVLQAACAHRPPPLKGD